MYAYPNYFIHRISVSELVLKACLVTHYQIILKLTSQNSQYQGAYHIKWTPLYSIQRKAEWQTVQCCSWSSKWQTIQCFSWSCCYLFQKNATRKRWEKGLQHVDMTLKLIMYFALILFLLYSILCLIFGLLACVFLFIVQKIKIKMYLVHNSSVGSHCLAL